MIPRGLAATTGSARLAALTRHVQAIQPELDGVLRSR
jgi:hypothetical protein